MALIKCPECGKEVSDQAETCIHCGYPIKKEYEEKEKTSQVNEADAETATESGSTTEVKESDEEKKKRRRNIAIIVVVIVAVIIVLIAVFEYTAHSYSRAEKRAQEAQEVYRSISGYR